MAIYDFARLGAGRASSIDPFPDPFTDYASLVMPETIEDALRWCLVPGTPVEMADLTTKPVEQVKAGDIVLTRGRTHERVVTGLTRQVDEDILEIAYVGYGKSVPLQITGNHRVWRIAAKDKCRPTHQDIKLENVEEVRADQVKVGDYLLSPLPVRGPKMTCRYDGWLVGMYLAEGNVCRDGDRCMRTRFTLGEDDETTGILQKLIDELHAASGIEVDLDSNPSNPTSRIVNHSDPELPAWLALNCPGLVKSKRLSVSASSWSDETLLGVIAGWIDGDGCIKSGPYRGKCAFSGAAAYTVSGTLASQLLRLSNMAGLKPSICHVSNNRGYAEHLADAKIYAVGFGKEDCAKLLKYCVKLQLAEKEFGSIAPKQAAPKTCIIGDQFIARRITGIKKRRYKGPVHTLEVANDHSYVANGVVVSNCQAIVSVNGVYAAALQRVVGFFITDIKLEGASSKERDRYSEFLHDTLGIKSILRAIALDFLVYGNSFTSLVVPFRRYLSCPECGFDSPLKNIKKNGKFNYRWKNLDFYADCPFCHYSGKWTHIDRRAGEDEPIGVKRWNPLHMELLWDPYSDNVGHVWKIPAEYRTDIRKGELHHLEQVPWEVVQSIRVDGNLEFENGVIYHMKEECLAGILNRGWGISRVLTNFRQAWYVQVLHRYNEAIGMDYIIPFRVITPDPRPGGTGENGDPVLNMDMGGFASTIHSMLRTRKQDPMSWHVSPYPLKYNVMGGEASSMAPFQLMDQAMDTLLNAVGVPVELYKANLQLQAAPAALRLMESNWSHLTHALNRFLHWLVTKISEVMAWDTVTCKLERPSHADDLNRQLAKLQLMMAGQLSQTTGMRSIGADFKQEQKQMLEEQQFTAEETQKTQETLEATQLGKQMAQQQDPSAQGQPAPGGDPSAAGAQPGAQQGVQPGAPVDPVQAALAMLPRDGQPISPPELEQAAETIAQTAFGMMQPQKLALLRQLKNKSEVVWYAVKSKLEKMNDSARNQGLAMQQQAAQQAQQQQITPQMK